MGGARVGRNSVEDKYIYRATWRSPFVRSCTETKVYFSLRDYHLALAHYTKGGTYHKELVKLERCPVGEWEDWSEDVELL